MEAGYGHFVLSFWCLMEGDKTNKRQNEISFLRFGDLYNATKRTNDKTKWPQKPHFVALSFCRFGALWKSTKRRNDKTNKLPRQIKLWYFAVTLSFCRSVVLWGRRQNEKTKKWNPFLRFGDLYNATERTNEEMKFRYFVFAFIRFGTMTNATKRTNEEMKFHFFVLATCTTRQNEQTKKWNSISSFSHLFVLAPWPTRQNEQTKKSNSIFSFWRLVQRDKTNKRRNEILFWRSVVCPCKEILSDSLQSINFKVQRWFILIYKGHFLFLEKCVINFSRLKFSTTLMYYFACRSFSSRLLKNV